MDEFEAMHEVKVLEMKGVLVDEEIRGYHAAKNSFSLNTHGDEAVLIPEPPTNRNLIGEASKARTEPSSYSQLSINL
jgi:hypothetical protein